MKNAQILSCHAGLIKTISGGHEFRKYFENFNLDIYYGISMNWKITNKFVLNTNFRLNNTIDKTITTYKKSNPILFMIGTRFQL